MGIGSLLLSLSLSLADSVRVRTRPLQASGATFGAGEGSGTETGSAAALIATDSAAAAFDRSCFRGCIFFSVEFFWRGWVEDSVG